MARFFFNTHKHGPALKAALVLLALTGANIGWSAELSGMVPERYRQEPVVIGTTATMPPVESVDASTGNVVGIEPDLARAIAGKLGVKVEIKNVAFDGLLAGMQAGRFDIAMSGLADTVQRQQAMDFVDWYVSGMRLVVKKGNPKKVTNGETLCGLTLGGPRNSTQYREMEALAKACKSTTMTVASESSPAGLVMLNAGRIDVYGVDSLSGPRYVASNPDVELVPGVFAEVTRGAAFAKNNAALRDAWQAGLKAIIASGEYDRIMARWDASNAAYKQATINAASRK